MSRQRLSERTQAGVTLIEALVGSFIIMVVIMGVFPMIVMATRGNTSDRSRLSAANEARHLLEQLRAQPYDTLAPGDDTSDPAFLGYYESDIDAPGYDAGDDFYYSEDIRLATGHEAVRYATITPIDDSLDGIDGDDTDGKTIDYKEVSVVVAWAQDGQRRSVRSSTIVEGESFIVVTEDKKKKKKKGGKTKGKGGKGKGKDSGKKKEDSKSE